MPGPNFIHVRDSDSRVLAVYSTTHSTAHHTVAVTEYNETHPLFVPAIKSTRWERQGVNTYVNIGIDAGEVSPEERALNTWVQSGGVENLRANGMRTAAWGHEESLAGVKEYRNGEILGWSVAHEGVVNSGTCDFTITINGVLQNAAEYVLQLSSGVNSHSLNFETPIPFNVGDIVNAISDSTDLNDSNGNDVTLSMWYRDR